MKKRDVEAAIRSEMEGHGWALQSICGLARAYVRAGIVLPYFSCGPVRTAKNGYFMVDGFIGFIYPRFESEWSKTHKREPGDSGFAAILHIANLAELREHVLVHTDSMDKDVHDLCQRIISLLDQMPADEESLRLAVAEEELLQRQIDHFSGFSNREKFYALKGFIASQNALH